MTTEFTKEELKELIDDSETLIKEEREASIAKAQALEVQESHTIQRVDMAKSRAKQVSNSSQQMEKVLDEISSSHDRIRQIQANPVLRIIEPVAGKFSKNFSQDKLLQDIQNSSIRLDLIRQTDELRKSEFDSAVAELDAELAAVVASSNIEANEAATLAQKIKTQLESSQRIAAFREEVLNAAESPEAIRKLVDEGVISERSAELELRTRKGERFQDEQVAFERARIERTTESFILEDADLESLTNGEFAKANPDIPMSRIREEANRKSQNELALNQLRLSSLQAARNERLNALSDKELQEKADEGDEFAKSTLGERKDKEAVRINRELAAEQARQVSDQNAIALFLRTSTTKTQTELFEKAQSNDGVTKIPGTETDVSIEQINSAIKERTIVELEQIEQLAGSGEIKTSVNQNINAVSRALGLPENEQADPIAHLNNIIQSNAPVETKDMARELAAKLAVIENTSVNPQTISLTKLKIKELTAQLREREIERFVSSKPREQQAGAKEFAESGQISDKLNAINIVATSTFANEFSGIDRPDSQVSPAYAESLRILSIHAKESFSSSTGAESEQASILQQLDDTSPIDVLQSQLLNQETQAIVAAPIINTTMQDALAATAEAMGNQKLADEIRSPESQFINDSFEFEVPKVLAAIGIAEKELGFSVQDYVRQFRQTMSSVIQQHIQPTGPGALEMAAMNRILFTSNPEAYMRFILDEKIISSQIGLDGFIKRQRRIQGVPQLIRNPLIP